MISIADQEALEQRADNLGVAGFNGFEFVLVDTDTAGGSATLEVHFHNDNHLDAVVADGRPARDMFSVVGGHRVRGGVDAGDVQVEAISKPVQGVLELTVAPIGDYSTYTLKVGGIDDVDVSGDPVLGRFDPVLSVIDFKFRPGCFNLCAPNRPETREAPSQPVIDYLAKDYDSFRHVMMTAMERRIPGWEPTSEADFTQVLISQVAAAADELSDFQDRVMNEAYLTRARNRVSLARHARLVDYHVHQGNQAETALAMKVVSGHDARFDDSSGEGLTFWAGNPEFDEQAVVFLPASAVSSDDDRVDYWLSDILNEIALYSWSDSQVGLRAGATEADLAMPSQAAADRLVALVTEERSPGEPPWVTRLLIEELLNPATGRQAGRDPTKRQLLDLTGEARKFRDPVTGDWYVRVTWRDENQLKRDYCFIADVAGGQVNGVSAFRGNLVDVAQGRVEQVFFSAPVPPPRTALPLVSGGRHINPRDFEETRKWGTLCRLPIDHRLLYRKTLPRSEEVPVSTLRVEVTDPEEGIWDGSTGTFTPGAIPPNQIRPKTAPDGTEVWVDWEEEISLIFREENDEVFAVETDELRRSRIRFGNGRSGRLLPDRAVVRCTYQVGDGLSGNVGADTIAHFKRGSGPETAISQCWNPFDVSSGRSEEPSSEVVRNAPEAYRSRQLRAVTLSDYVDRVEELDGVSRAHAAYHWTGSWRTVRVTIDPVGTDELEDVLRDEALQYLDAVRLIGEDLEIRSPVLVPLDIRVTLCARSDIWPEDLRAELERELSDEYTADGRRGFFQPDRWTFGQPVHASNLLGRIHGVTGVDHVVSLTMARWGWVPTDTDKIEPGDNEIISVRNDPDHMEWGMISLDIQGGRG